MPVHRPRRAWWVGSTGWPGATADVQLAVDPALGHRRAPARAPAGAASWWARPGENGYRCDRSTWPAATDAGQAGDRWSPAAWAGSRATCRSAPSAAWRPEPGRPVPGGGGHPPRRLRPPVRGAGGGGARPPTRAGARIAAARRPLRRPGPVALPLMRAAPSPSPVGLVLLLLQSVLLQLRAGAPADPGLRRCWWCCTWGCRRAGRLLGRCWWRSRWATCFDLVSGAPRGTHALVFTLTGAGGGAAGPRGSRCAGSSCGRRPASWSRWWARLLVVAVRALVSRGGGFAGACAGPRSRRLLTGAAGARPCWGCSNGSTAGSRRPRRARRAAPAQGARRRPSCRCG